MNENARRMLLGSLRELGNIELQQRVWVQGLGPECSSFVEAVCQAFDDTGLTELLKAPGSVAREFGVELEEELLRLDASLSLLPDDLVAAERLRHPDWSAVVEAANRAASLLARQVELAENRPDV